MWGLMVALWGIGLLVAWTMSLGAWGVPPLPALLVVAWGGAYAYRRITIRLVAVQALSVFALVFVTGLSSGDPWAAVVWGLLLAPAAMLFWMGPVGVVWAFVTDGRHRSSGTQTDPTP